MEITSVKVFPVSEEKLKAYVTIAFDDCFIIRDLKIIHGANGLFVAMPSRRRRDGSYRDIAHPLNSEWRDTMECAILDAYDAECGYVDELNDEDVEEIIEEAVEETAEEAVEAVIEAATEEITEEESQNL